MVAKVPPHANAGRFAKHDFTVDLVAWRWGYDSRDGHDWRS
jgi:hypothetical protein